jgi:hypothetical protein
MLLPFAAATESLSSGMATASVAVTALIDALLLFVASLGLPQARSVNGRMKTKVLDALMICSPFLPGPECHICFADEMGREGVRFQPA